VGERGFRRLLSHSAMAQVLSSLVSFGLSGFVMLNAPKADFGRYSLVLVAVLLFLGCANALIYLQMPVLRTALDDEASYFATLYRLLLSGVVLLSMVLLSAALGGWLAGWVTARECGLLAAALCLLLAQSSVEFARQMHYIIEDLASVVRMRLVLALVVTLGCGLILWSGVQDILIACVVLLATGHTLSLCCVDRQRFALRFASATPAMARRVWSQGRWALLNMLLSWLPAQGYLYLLTLIAGLEVVAEVNAAYNFVAPMMLLSTSFMSVVLPRLSAMPQDDNGAVNALRHAVLRLLGGGGLLYLLLLLSGFRWIDERFLIPRGYVDIGGYVALWFVAALMTFYRSNLAVVYQALNHYHRIVQLSLFYALTGMLLALVLIPLWGGHGALLGKAGAELVFVLLLRRALYNEQRLKKWQW